MIPTLKGFTQQLVPVNGIKINAVTGGSGPPILLLHGWPETWWEWHHVMPLLAEQFSVVAIDLRGAGGTALTAPRAIPYATEKGPANKVCYCRAPWGTMIEFITTPDRMAYHDQTDLRRWQDEE
ncbi:alpha/beta hydrolase family protein [Rhizobium sp. PP-CC-3A-592]|nr:alpha/beta hydrolase family protein [Rhizobium sp. PP-CC-3A-592]